MLILLCIIFFGGIALCVAAGVASGKQEADIKEQLHKKLTDKED